MSLNKDILRVITKMILPKRIYKFSCDRGIEKYFYNLNRANQYCLISTILDIIKTYQKGDILRVDNVYLNILQQYHVDSNICKFIVTDDKPTIKIVFDFAKDCTDCMCIYMLSYGMFTDLEVGCTEYFDIKGDNTTPMLPKRIYQTADFDNYSLTHKYVYNLKIANRICLITALKYIKQSKRLKSQSEIININEQSLNILKQYDINVDSLCTFTKSEVDTPEFNIYFDNDGHIHINYAKFYHSDGRHMYDLSVSIIEIE